MEDYIDKTPEATILGKRKHPGEKSSFYCSKCKNFFTTSNGLTNHQPSCAASHMCTSCDRSFFRASLLARHQLVHTGEKKFVCASCDQRFARSDGLARHQLVHTGDKRFACENCDQSFSRKDTLAEHQLVHTGEKNFACKTCNQSFSKSSTLAQHQLVHTGEKPFSCSKCAQRFSRNSGLTRHQLVHTGEKKFACVGCDQSFTRRDLLVRHQLVHTDSRPFSCASCDQSFTRSHALARHQLVHTGEKPFFCGICSVRFSRSGHLPIHTKRWHTTEGMNRKKKQEHRVRTLLKQHEFAVDEETVIRYRDGCVPDPDKFCARVDFHLPEITQALIILECDEHQHASYPISCERTRMEQIHEAILNGGITAPVLFIRYSPNGTIVKDGVKRKVLRKEREAALIKLLKDLKDGKLVLPTVDEKPLQVIYLFYSMEKEIPTICLDPDYSQQMYACVNLNLCRC